MSDHQTWTTDQLREIFNDRFNAFEKTIVASIKVLEDAATIATLTAERALGKADHENDLRFAGIDARLDKIERRMDELIRQEDDRSHILPITKESIWPIIGVGSIVVAALLLAARFFGF